ncbi:hypothetical protein ACWD0J_39840 [Streptomyces sp. NPDC003011]
MRLPTSALFCLAAAAAAHLPLASPAYADSCAAVSDGRAFPLTTRIHGGPDSYEAGGGFGVWNLDLTNITTRTCENIHPVVVLVDERRALEPGQPRLEFLEGKEGSRPHAVVFERTDADELVGVFAGEGDGFSGFTVGPGRTVSVTVRLAVTSDAVPNEVTAHAAVVQRHDDDGDWVGQSNAYRFGIEAETDTPRPSPSPNADASTPPAGRLPFADELARTGLGPTGGAAAAAVALLLVTAGALLLARRRR